MLAKKYRLNLRERPQFTKVFTLPYFVLKTRGNNGLYNRYGFLVSKKIDRRATVRNRLKRVTRSCLEEIFESINIGYDMLFILKKESLKVSRDSLCFSLKAVLKKEGLLK